MFIIKNILQKINSEYYRKYQDTSMIPLTLDSTPESIRRNKLISKTDNNKELTDILNDLEVLLFSKTSTYIFRSPCTASLFNLKMTLERRIKNTLKSETELSNSLRDIITILTKNSAESYIVGGFIRDSSMKILNKDIDFVTDIEYGVLLELLKKWGFSVSESGKQFLVLIASRGGESFEVSNFRTDKNYKDGRRPESVEIGTIEEDAFRRDFTINSLYYNLSSRELRDPTGFGIEDINDKKLRFVGKPKERIKEDYLRIFRFYRFLSKGFSPDSRSLKACREMFEEGIRKTSSERIKNEIERIVL